ncbi:MAG TPA: hypothetical protein VGJ86_13840 [Acidimicrobiales bacterium]
MSGREVAGDEVFQDLTVGGQSYGAIGGPTTVADPDLDHATDRIDLVVEAASHLTVTARP